jgi:transcriptional regulator with XRE-family HTH domain
MYKNRAPDGKRNLCGTQVAALRKAKKPKLSQRGLADMLQLNGLDVDKNAVQRIESGQRFVTDIELKALAQALGVTVEELLEP